MGIADHDQKPNPNAMQAAENQVLHCKPRRLKCQFCPIPFRREESRRRFPHFRRRRHFYAPAVNNGFVWDDTALVLRDPLIRSWRLIPEGFNHFLFVDATASDFYRPIQRLTYTLEYAAFAFRPAAYHLTNILLHAAAAIASSFSRKNSFCLSVSTRASGEGRARCHGYMGGSPCAQRRSRLRIWHEPIRSQLFLAFSAAI